MVKPKIGPFQQGSVADVGSVPAASVGIVAVDGPATVAEVILTLGKGELRRPGIRRSRRWRWCAAIVGPAASVAEAGTCPGRAGRELRAWDVVGVVAHSCAERKA